MPKLVIKQPESVQTSWLDRYSNLIAYLGLAMLLIVALGFVFYPSMGSSVLVKAPEITSVTDIELKNRYLAQWQTLKLMESSYQKLADQTVSDYGKTAALLSHSEKALDHLNNMQYDLAALKLSASEQESVLAAQQYWADQWQARLHFAELRLRRFQQTADTESSQQAILPVPVAPAASPEASTTTVAGEQAVPMQAANSRFIAPPPEGVKLPEGFCTLDGSGVCKPESSN